MNSLKNQVRDLDLTKKRKDYDIEDDVPLHNADSSESENSEDGSQQGRDHYESVGKSKLRKPTQVQLGAKYEGVAVSRKALEQDDDEEHDPFAPIDDDEEEDPFAIAENSDAGRNATENASVEGEINEDEEIESDEAFGESDAEKFKDFKFIGSSTTHGRKKDWIETNTTASDDTEDDNEGDEDEVTDEDVSAVDSDTDMEDFEGESDKVEDEDEAEGDEDRSEDEEERSAKPGRLPYQPMTKRDELRSLLSSDTAAIAASLSQAASGDAKKGKAVKQQHQTFDRLLDARIKLQKGLTIVNELKLPEESDSVEAEAQAALQKAENAALKLYSTIESFRASLLEVSAATTTRSSEPTKKHKRTQQQTSLTTPLPQIWSSLQDYEAESFIQRRTVLDKWSDKIKASDPSQAATASRSKFANTGASNQSKLSSVLDAYLSGEQDKLVAAATTTIDDSASNQDARTRTTYDDASFYQSLLRDLIASRSSTSSALNPLGNTSNIPLKLHPSGNKAHSKAGKVIDTKASKGRKIRYTVHEKLENFMASQGDLGRNTAQWTDSAKAEFFGSLFGAQRVLNEDDRDGDVQARNGEDGDDREVEALRLFRS